MQRCMRLQVFPMSYTGEALPRFYGRDIKHNKEEGVHDDRFILYMDLVLHLPNIYREIDASFLLQPDLIISSASNECRMSFDITILSR